LYLHGLSSRDFVPALEGFLGTDAGLSATITRLTTQWPDDARARRHPCQHPPRGQAAVPVRAYRRRVDGAKELLALADGYRESTGSWADLLRDCKRRDMRAPVVAAGDGAPGFWGALREVFPETKEQRCWFHKIANVLAALPRSAHLSAKKALAEIWNARLGPNASRRGAVPVRYRPTARGRTTVYDDGLPTGEELPFQLESTNPPPWMSEGATGSDRSGPSSGLR
jgi:hypothetical protein